VPKDHSFLHSGSGRGWLLALIAPRNLSARSRRDSRHLHQRHLSRGSARRSGRSHHRVGSWVPRVPSRPPVIRERCAQQVGCRGRRMAICFVRHDQFHVPSRFRIPRNIWKLRRRSAVSGDNPSARWHHIAAHSSAKGWRYLAGRLTRRSSGLRPAALVGYLARATSGPKPLSSER